MGSGEYPIIKIGTVSRSVVRHGGIDGWVASTSTQCLGSDRNQVDDVQNPRKEQENGCAIHPRIRLETQRQRLCAVRGAVERPRSDFCAKWDGREG
jgi:hypothetical protein